MVSCPLACSQAEGYYVNIIIMQIGGIGGSSCVKNEHFQRNWATDTVSTVPAWAAARPDKGQRCLSRCSGRQLGLSKLSFFFSTLVSFFSKNSCMKLWQQTLNTKETKPQQWAKRFPHGREKKVILSAPLTHRAPQFRRERLWWTHTEEKSKITARLRSVARGKLHLWSSNGSL